MAIASGLQIAPETPLPAALAATLHGRCELVSRARWEWLATPYSRVGLEGAWSAGRYGSSARKTSSLMKCMMQSRHASMLG